MSTIFSILPASGSIQSSGDGASVAGPPSNAADFSVTLDQAKSRPAPDSAPSPDTSLKPTRHKKSASKAGNASTPSASAKSAQPTKTKTSDATTGDSSENANADSAPADSPNAQQQGLKPKAAESNPGDEAQNTQAQGSDSTHPPGAVSPASGEEDTTDTAASTPSKTKTSGTSTQQGVDPTALSSVIAGAAGTQNSVSTADATGAENSPSGTISGKPNVSPFKPGDAAETDPNGQQTTDAAADAEAAANSSLGSSAKATDKGAALSNSAGDASFAALLPPTGPHPSSATSALAAPLPVAQPAEVQFAQANNPSIVSSIHGQLLPDGGTMSIWLDPPELGAMQITVKIESGVISASFETSSDQATRLLSHTLSDLKGALESQGVSVDSLHVHQSSRSDNSSNQQGESNPDRQGPSDQRSADQEQERREMLRRMWKKVNGTEDPLDLVA
jgi:flagellar hook-length control protein FliK